MQNYFQVPDRIFPVEIFAFVVLLCVEKWKEEVMLWNGFEYFFGVQILNILFEKRDMDVGSSAGAERGIMMPLFERKSTHQAVFFGWGTFAQTCNRNPHSLESFKFHCPLEKKISSFRFTDEADYCVGLGSSMQIVEQLGQVLWPPGVSSSGLGLRVRLLQVGADVHVLGDNWWRWEVGVVCIDSLWHFQGVYGHMWRQST